MDNDKDEYLFDDDEEIINSKKQLDSYGRRVKNIQKNESLDEDEYLFLTQEMNKIISDNKDNFSDIELLELTEKLDKIELTKDYTTELLELTKQIKRIINPGRKYVIPKVDKAENTKKEKVTPLSSTSVIPKIKNNKEIEKNNGKLTLKELVDKNTDNNKIKPFDTQEIKKLKSTIENTNIKKNKKKVSKIEKIIWTVIFIISIVTFLALSIRFLRWELENRSNKHQLVNIYELADINEVVAMGAITDVEEEKVPDNKPSIPESRPNDYWYYMSMSMLNANFDELKTINNDTVGWIQVPGTNINYPYVQTTDNSYYLKHSFNKSYNSAGWVFLDYRNNKDEYGKNTILYAHGRLDDTMFGSLRNVVSPSWYNNSNNYVVKTSTPTANALWQVFSTYKIVPESYYIKTKFSTDEEFDTFINTVTSRSVHDFKVNMSPNDKILTLSSCYDSTYRVVLHAKLIRIEEK